MNIQPIEAKTYSSHLFVEGISDKAVEEHFKLYNGYVKKYNEINEKLSTLSDTDYSSANQTYSYLRALKTELTFAYGGVINHEVYFSHLGGNGGEPSGELLSQIKKDFGSFEAYRNDLKATGLSARGWVWTGWNKRERRLFNYLGDAQNAFPVWFTRPILALDTYEHAYMMDYGVNRGGYIDVFLASMRWDVVEGSFADALKCRM